MHSGQPPCTRIRVILADASPITAQLLAEAIGKDSQIDVVRFGSEPAEIIRSLAVDSPDVLLISARMEEEQNRGLDLLRYLRGQRKNLKAVVLLDSRRPDSVVESFRSGACGVFSRTASVELLIKCIAAVHHGQIWANSIELGFLLEAFRREGPLQLRESPGLGLLSVRERSVMACLAEGLTNRQIAERLKISPHTVKNYIFKIFDKLGVSNRVEAVSYVLSCPNEFTQPVSESAVVQPDQREKNSHFTKTGTDAPMSLTPNGRRLVQSEPFRTFRFPGVGR